MFMGQAIAIRDDVDDAVIRILLAAVVGVVGGTTGVGVVVRAVPVAGFEYGDGLENGACGGGCSDGPRDGETAGRGAGASYRWFLNVR